MADDENYRSGHFAHSYYGDGFDLVVCRSSVTMGAALRTLSVIKEAATNDK